MIMYQKSDYEISLKYVFLSCCIILFQNEFIKASLIFLNYVWKRLLNFEKNSDPAALILIQKISKTFPTLLFQTRE